MAKDRKEAHADGPAPFLASPPTASPITILLPFLCLWLPLVLALATTAWLLSSAHKESLISRHRAEETGKVQLAQSAIEWALSTVQRDLAWLSRSRLLTAQPPSPEGMQLDQVFNDYIREIGIYERILLVDANGVIVQEIARDDAIPAPASVQLRIIPVERSQSESPVIHASDFGIGSDPTHSVIRFGTPVYDTLGQFTGSLQIDFLGKRIFHRLSQIDSISASQLMLADQLGYWLRGPAPDAEWGNILPGRQAHRLSHTYPALWQALQSADQRGQFLDASGDLFTYTRLQKPYAQESDPPVWTVVSRLPAAVYLPVSTRFNQQLSVSVLLLSMTLGIFIWLAVLHFARNRCAEKSIATNADLLQGLLESAPDGIVITDTDGRIMYINHQAETLFGHTPEQLIGQPVEVLVPERSRTLHTLHRQEYIETPIVRPMGAGLELFGARRDGSEFPVSISLSPIHTARGAMVFADIRDVTRERETEHAIGLMNEQLRQRNIALESLNRELEAFSYSVSHDLRAPLRAIDGFSKIVLEEYREKLDANGVERLERIRRAAQRMGVLIDDILKLSRVSRADLHLESVDLSSLCEDILDNLHKQEEPRHVEQSIQPGMTVLADPHLLRVAMENLLGNAWKFTGRQEHARISIRCDNSGKAPVFHIQDNGAGFDMTYADKLFTAFQRLHDATEFSGTGIGLATVQRIIHKHGGRIWANSQPDQGATFSFTLSSQE